MLTTTSKPKLSERGPLLTRRQFLTRGLVALGSGGVAEGLTVAAQGASLNTAVLHVRVARLEAERFAFLQLFSPHASK